MDNQIQNTIENIFSQMGKLKDDCKNQTQPLYSQIKSIENSFSTQIKVFEQKLENIQEQYYEIALDLAIEKQKHPRSRSGGYPTPDEINIDETGIYFIWSYLDYNDYFFASWEDIITFQNQQINNI